MPVLSLNLSQVLMKDVFFNHGSDILYIICVYIQAI